MLSIADTVAAPLPTVPVVVRGPSGGSSVSIGGRGTLAVIAGPCVIEDDSTPIEIARAMRDACAELGLPYVFKASYDKANRSSVASFRGLGAEEGLAVLARVREEAQVPVLTDVHGTAEVAAAAAVVDVLQVPAFLCRQTELLVACGKTGKPVNIKKGQFVAPGDMHLAVTKVYGSDDACEAALASADSGQARVMLTERGATFGYNNLVVDMRGIATMQATSRCPVIFDGGHSVQAPGGLGHASGGDRSMIPVLCRAAVAAGCDAVFLETHPDPSRALSDGPNSYPLADMPALLAKLAKIAAVVREG